MNDKKYVGTVYCLCGSIKCSHKKNEIINKVISLADTHVDYSFFLANKIEE